MEKDNYNNVNNKNLEEKHSKIEKKTSFKVLKQEQKENKEKKYSLGIDYKSRSRSSTKKYKKSACKLKKKNLI